MQQKRIKNQRRQKRKKQNGKHKSNFINNNVNVNRFNKRLSGNIGGKKQELPTDTYYPLET